MDDVRDQVRVGHAVQGRDVGPLPGVLGVIRLLDGPAKGSYGVRRAPVFLRVVVTTAGKVDILDLLSDTPRKGETVHVYRAVKGTTFMPSDNMRICVMGKDGELTSAASAEGDYHHLPDVDGASVRTTADWREWVMSQPEVVV